MCCGRTEEPRAGEAARLANVSKRLEDGQSQAARRPATAEEKLAWLVAQKAAGKLDGDDPDEVAEAQALLAMLARLARTKAHKQHLNDLLDEGLKATFPASDPIAVGGFTGAEVLPSP